MGFGKMPADCAAILLANNIDIQDIWETERSVFSPLQGFCKRYKISFKRPARNETTVLLESIKKPTVVLSINNNYIFPRDILRKKKLRVINFHNSLLPFIPDMVE